MQRAAPPPTDPPGPNVKVWVGKLPVTVSEEFLEKVMGVLGRVVEWKRVTDPVSGKLKPFGFVTWDSPKAALLGIKLLQAGAPLLLARGGSR